MLGSFANHNIHRGIVKLTLRCIVIAEVEFASFLYSEFTSSSTGQKTGKLQLCGLIKQSGPRQRGNQMVATSVLSRVKLTL